MLGCVLAGRDDECDAVRNADEDACEEGGGEDAAEGGGEDAAEGGGERKVFHGVTSPSAGSQHQY